MTAKEGRMVSSSPIESTSEGPVVLGRWREHGVEAAMWGKKALVP